MPARTEPAQDGPPVLEPAEGGPVTASNEVGSRPTSGRFRLPDMSRRGFLRTGSIGVLAAGVVGSVPGLSSLLSSAETDAPEVGGGGAAAVQGGAAAVQGGAAAEGDASGLATSFSARVSNLSTGEMKLFVGNQTLQIRDADLAQRLNQAARAAQAAGR